MPLTPNIKVQLKNNSRTNRAGSRLKQVDQSMQHSLIPRNYLMPAGYEKSFTRT